MTFDPTAPQAAHWRRWLTEAPGDRGIPPNAGLELQVRPSGGAAITRLQLDLRWAEPDAERRVVGESAFLRRDYWMVRLPIMPSSKWALPVAGSGTKQMKA